MMTGGGAMALAGVSLGEVVGVLREDDTTEDEAGVSGMDRPCVSSSSSSITLLLMSSSWSTSMDMRSSPKIDEDEGSIFGVTNGASPWMAWIDFVRVWLDSFKNLIWLTAPRSTLTRWHLELVSSRCFGGSSLVRSSIS